MSGFNWFQFGQNLASSGNAALSGLASSPGAISGLTGIINGMVNPAKADELNKIAQAETLVGINPAVAIAEIIDVLKEPGLPPAATATLSAVLTILQASGAAAGSVGAASNVNMAVTELQQARQIIEQGS